MFRVRKLSNIIAWILVSLALTNCSGSPDSTEAEITPPVVFAQDAEWEAVGEGLVYTDGVATKPDGDVYFADTYQKRLYKLNATGEVSLVEESSQMTMGLMIGPDGLLYACRNLAAQIIRYNAEGNIEVLLQGELSPVPDEKDNPGEFCNDLAINADGGIWFTDRVNKRVRYLAPDGSVRDVAEGFRPNGIVLSLDRKMLVVTDSNVPVLHAFSVGKDGELAELPGYFDPIRLLGPMPDGTLIAKGKPGTNGMSVDTEGRFYVSSLYGIQMFDRDGKYLGVLTGPKGLYFLSSIGFGGADYQWLFATGRGGVFRIKTQAQGAGW